MQRCIPITMMLGKNRYEDFDLDVHSPQLRELEARARDWAKQNRDRLAAIKMKVKANYLQDRVRSNWLPLIAVANAAGGEWPKCIKEIAEQVEGKRPKRTSELRILYDVKATIESDGRDLIGSKWLLGKLNKNSDWSYGDLNGGRGLTEHALGAMLNDFLGQLDLKGVRQRVKGKLTRGWHRNDLEAVFAAYGVTDSVTTERRK